MKQKRFKMKGFYLLVMVAILMSTGCQRTESIKIGVVAILSGENSKLSSSSINGLDIAIDEINQSGGIDGRQIELAIKDTEGQDEKAIKVNEAFVDEDVKIVFGPFTSGMVTKSIDYINSKDMLVIGPTASADSLEGRDDHYIRFIGSARNEAIALSDAAVKLNDKSFVVIYDDVNKGFADELAQDFKAEIMAKTDGDATLVAIDPQKLETLEVAMAKVRELKPDAVLFATSERESAGMAEKIKVMSPEIQLYNSMWANTNELIKLGSSYVEDMIVVSDINPNGPSEAYINFKSTYMERFGEEPDFAAVYSYDAMKALIEAMSTAESLEPMVIKDKILEISRYDGLHGLYSIDAYGDAWREYNVFKIEEGNLVPLK
ncbi:ABC transporter substrate-binding protein [Fusibacter ferrireducens]|uniref:ABC transporter substrate-binding protein n=1 Tax=Fusibacter ferrireducens TaxID=2785058 RepID=A0ABR9ZXQ9_9FIRM|nr:ABC transporter substrate-binding protein [Fusibacter ferrireducens]MBF4695237.1 ABC transporter substrate-binding protein [Fusibacter ferrireducens]